VTRFLSILLLAVAPFAQAQRFSLIQTPDPHAEFSTLTNYGLAWVNWIFAHTNDGDVNAKIVAICGDAFESQRQFNDPQAAAAGYYLAGQLTNDVQRLRSAGFLVIITDGNHDSDNTNSIAGWCPFSVSNQFNTVWGAPDTFTNNPWLKTNAVPGDYKQTGHVFTNGNLRLAFATFHSDPDTNTPTITYQGQVSWVSNFLAQYPDHNGIVLTHYMLSTNFVPEYADGSAQYFNIGPAGAVFTNRLHVLQNLALILSGHNPYLLAAHYRTNGTDGHEIRVLQFNQQTIPARRNMDYLRVVTFDYPSSQIIVRTVCVSSNSWLADYETTSGFTNFLFPGGYQHNFTMPLPIRPRTFPIFRR